MNKILYIFEREDSPFIFSKSLSKNNSYQILIKDLKNIRKFLNIKNYNSHGSHFSLINFHIDFLLE